MYKGANAQIQGGCADLLALATVRCADWLEDNAPEIDIFNLVHDEIDFEMPEEAIPDVVPPLMEIMELRDVFDVHFFTDVKVGKDYGSMKELQIGGTDLTPTI